MRLTVDKKTILGNFKSLAQRSGAKHCTERYDALPNCHSVKLKPKVFLKALFISIRHVRGSTVPTSIDPLWELVWFFNLCGLRQNRLKRP